MIDITFVLRFWLYTMAKWWIWPIMQYKVLLHTKVVEDPWLRWVICTCIQGCLYVRPSISSVHPSVTSDKVHIRLKRVNVLLTLDRVNLDLLCPWWLPHRCHVGWSGLLRAHTAGWGAHTLVEGRIRLSEGCIRWRRGTYACLRGAYACRRGAYACLRGACPRGANIYARGTHNCLRGAYSFNMLLQKLTHTLV
jgi:hypothetical protein